LLSRWREYEFFSKIFLFFILMIMMMMIYKIIWIK
jgi:hypothetical protein